MSASVCWDVSVVAAANLQLPLSSTEAVIKLLQDDNTVPFIARYRKETTGGMTETEIRKIEREHKRLSTVIVKQESVVNILKKTDGWSPALEDEIKQATSLEEIEELYEPYKKKGKKSLAEKAKERGLQPVGERILHYQQAVDLNHYVDTSKEGLKSVNDVKTGVKHVIADIIAKDIPTREDLRKRVTNSAVWESKQSKCKKQEKGDSSKRKYEDYYAFSTPVRGIRSHQVLAMNRGEDKKVLSIKISLPTEVESSFLSWCQQHWIKNHASKQASELISAAIKDSYTRLLLPKQCRDLRRAETRKAEREAITTFSSNLRNILLTAPVRGATVLGIDPGYAHGCKLAVVDPTGRILDTSVIYIIGRNNAGVDLQRIINSNKCTVIAIGNGKGSRESEELVSQLIQSGRLWRKDILFCVINEAGASIYSVSSEAQREMPSLDPNLRSAVSIARRLQDPMAELVKIDPKHIGVGLYQHDMPQKLLDEAVNAVVEDAVSFVGVDLNACSEALLCRVAGMSEKRAKAVIEYRNKQGLFVNRSQLKNVKGIGEKTFQQCAGFLRIHQLSSSSVMMEENQNKLQEIPGVWQSRKRKGDTMKGTASKRKKKESDHEPQPLDETNIHPESYEATRKLLDLSGGTTKELGKQSLKTKLSASVKHREKDVAEEIGVGVPTLQLIIEALEQPSRDVRSDFNKPVFRHSVMSMSDIYAGMTLTGRVENVVPFGAFVDVGVESSGLIHTRWMGGRHLKVGDSVSVSVMNVDQARGRISLKLNVPV